MCRPHVLVTRKPSRLSRLNCLVAPAQAGRRPASTPGSCVAELHIAHLHLAVSEQSRRTDVSPVRDLPWENLSEWGRCTKIGSVVTELRGWTRGIGGARGRARARRPQRVLDHLGGGAFLSRHSALLALINMGWPCGRHRAPSRGTKPLTVLGIVWKHGSRACSSCRAPDPCSHGSRAWTDALGG